MEIYSPWYRTTRVAKFVQSAAAASAVINVIIGVMLAFDSQAGAVGAYVFISGALIGCAVLWLFGSLVEMVAEGLDRLIMLQEQVGRVDTRRVREGQSHLEALREHFTPAEAED